MYLKKNCNFFFFLNQKNYGVRSDASFVCKPHYVHADAISIHMDGSSCPLRRRFAFAWMEACVCMGGGLRLPGWDKCSCQRGKLIARSIYLRFFYTSTLQCLEVMDVPGASVFVLVRVHFQTSASICMTTLLSNNFFKVKE
jgi:hypothetical protein